MAEYNLSINLIDNVSEKLDALMSKVNSLGKGNAPKGSFSDWLSGAGAYKNRADAEKAGEKIGEALGDGISKGLKYKSYGFAQANRTGLLNAVLPGASFMNDPGFFTRKMGSSSASFGGDFSKNVFDIDESKAAAWMKERAAELRVEQAFSDAFEKIHTGGEIKPEMQGPGLGGAGKAFAAGVAKSRIDEQKFYANMSMMAGPLLNPGGGLSTMFAARQIYSAFNTQKGQGLLAGSGFGSGSATAVTVAGLTGVGLALKGFMKIFSSAAGEINDIMNQYAESSTRYAKALSSGLGLGLTTEISEISHVAGIAESDFFKFSYAIKDVADKTKIATKSLSENASVLTTVERERKAAELAEKAFDAERARTYSGLTFLHFQGKREQAEENISYRKKFNDFLERIHLLAPASVNPTTIERRWMNPSSWEKMGLIMGGGLGGGNSIEKNTKDTVKVLKSIQLILKNGHGGGGATTWTAPDHSTP